jgi:tetratricopeptide (TPR) repeat protein
MQNQVIFWRQQLSLSSSTKPALIMTASIAIITQTELLQLALDADKNNNRGVALSYLKEAVSRPDATAAAHFMLGAEYAQIQMYDRAIAEMESALKVDPSLSLARIQLGLLLLGAGAVAQAVAQLTPLAALPETNPLHCFGRGLLSLAHEDFNTAMGFLIQGISINTSNAPLNTDMQRLIDDISKLPPEVLHPKTGQDALPSDPSARHIFLSAYTGNRTH